MKRAFLKLRAVVLKGVDQGKQFEFTINTNGTESIFSSDLEYKEMTLLHYPLYNDSVGDLPFTFNLTAKAKNLTNNQVSPIVNITLNLNDERLEEKATILFDSGNPENFPQIDLYWEANPFSSVFSELFEIANCLCKAANVYEAMAAPQQTDYDNLHQVSTNPIFIELAKIATAMGSEFIPFDPSLIFCENLKNLIDNLRWCQAAWNHSSVVAVDYNALEGNFQSFKTAFEAFKTALEAAGINPCSKVDTGHKYGVLCDLYDKELDCICKFISQKASFPPNIQAKISELEAEGEYYLGDLYNFLGHHNINDYPQFDLSGSNPFCNYYTAIIGLLKWICDNQLNFPFEPEKVFDIQNGWTKILDLLKELKALDPNVCSGVTNPWGKNAKLMSDYLYLQASGADASDGIAEGIHLRWALRKEVGENHIPKGDLANKGATYYSNFGYNKDNDVVKIHKTPYTTTVPVELDLNINKPYDVVSNSNERKWHIIVNNTHGAHSIQNEVIVRFFDFAAYDGIAIDPKVNAIGFLSNYGQYFEVEVKDKLLFAADIEIKSVGGSSPMLKYETVAVDEPNSTEFEITSRQTLSNSSADLNQRIVGENIKYIRMEFNSGDCGLISLETYLDFLKTRPSWTAVDNFGLSLTNTEVFDRLDNVAWTNSIDNNWPRFNHGTTLKKANYEDKWSGTQGLKDALTSYLDLSKSDMKAYAELVSEDPKDLSTSKPVLPINYLDMLNLVGMDYHVARMLGLGHIDEFNLNNDKYVYIAIYNTHPDLPQNRTADTYDHVYMALPTDKSDFREPHKPALSSPMEYGLKSFDEEVGSKMLKDGGYSRFGNDRFVAISRNDYNYEVPFEGFFETVGDFDVTNSIKPVFYGIEYKQQGASDFVKPEITADDSGYKDHDNTQTEVFEIIPVAESENPLYTHRETNEGIHEYALYGINWFARSSDVSDAVATDETIFDFKPIKTPLDAHAHYIQDEDPRIFTSLNEQNDLETRITANPSADNFWTRVTFNWNHLHNMAYQGATKVEFFFREDLPLGIRGKVKEVIDIDGEDAVFVVTEKYHENSLDGNSEVKPEIATADKPKFIGSLLNIDGERYEVISITQASSGPKLKVKLTSETQTVLGEEGKLEPIITWNKPVSGSYFQLTENLSNEANWTKLSKTISLDDFNSTRTEDITEPGGDAVTYNIGGIEGDAIIIEDPATEPMEGLYKITFDTVTLADHAQKSTEHVDWCQGVIRVPTNGGDLKGLKVSRIESQSPLVVWAIDAEPASNSEPTAVKTNTSTSVDINFHPGYRVYLEPEPTNNLDKSHLIPSDNSSKKTALLAIRSIDDSDTDPAKHAFSELSNPLSIFGLNIKTPQKPSEPIGPAYSTRPDTFGKCSYTFDIETTVEPFSIAVYRTHESALLEALYEETTVETIFEDLEALDPNDNQIQRFNDLANVVLDADTNHVGEWKEYDGYRFPNPDLTDLLDGNETQEEKKHKIRVAVTRTFIPVSEQPIIYEFVEDGTNTSSDTPVIRDKNGHLLASTASEFNPFPYARKFTSTVDSKPYLRFTDYKLDGASQNLYFYFAVEITRELKMSEPSQTLGPVRIINAFPAEAPYVKKVETVLANPSFETGPGVRFYMNPYLPDENIKAFRIYRTTNELMTASVQLMEDAGTVTMENELIDFFEGLTFPPFNQDIYYRIVALREILNEQDELEYVPSKPSEVVKGQVVDNVNPPAPEITHTIGSTSTSPDKIHNVTLTWSETCYEGKYTLYKMTDMGQWQLVASFDFNDTLSFNYTDLDKEDADGNTIYHRFKVVAENTGGLLSLEEEILTI